MRFVFPVFIGDVITTTATVNQIREEKGIVKLDTACSNQDGKIVVEGEALVMILN
jgi:3-hydroxybutyryl-CoA dehydratase